MRRSANLPYTSTQAIQTLPCLACSPESKSLPASRRRSRPCGADCPAHAGSTRKLPRDPALHRRRRRHRRARGRISLLGRVRRRPFELRVEDLKSFGGRTPRAVVATIGPMPAAIELQAEHERLMQRVGIEPEGRKYIPACDACAAARIFEPASGRLSRAAGAVSLCAVQRVAFRAVLVARIGRRRPVRRRGGLPSISGQVSTSGIKGPDT